MKLDYHMAPVGTSSQSLPLNPNPSGKLTISLAHRKSPHLVAGFGIAVSISQVEAEDYEHIAALRRISTARPP